MQKHNGFWDFEWRFEFLGWGFKNHSTACLNRFQFLELVRVPISKYKAFPVSAFGVDNSCRLKLFGGAGSTFIFIFILHMV